MARLELLLGGIPRRDRCADGVCRIAMEVPTGLPSELLERRRISSRPRSAWPPRSAGSRNPRPRACRAFPSPVACPISQRDVVLEGRENRSGGRVGGSWRRCSGGALKAQVEIRRPSRSRRSRNSATALKAFSDVKTPCEQPALQATRGNPHCRHRRFRARACLAQTRYRVGSGDLRSVQQQQVTTPVPGCNCWARRASSAYNA